MYYIYKVIFLETDYFTVAHFHCRKYIKIMRLITLLNLEKDNISHNIVQVKVSRVPL